MSKQPSQQPFNIKAKPGKKTNSWWNPGSKTYWARKPNK